jgi:tetratricopeptide (TPR) repeat protein
MKKITILFLLLFACTPRHSIYESSLRGSKSETEAQRKSDSLFVLKEINKHGSNQNASKHNSKIGWEYLYSTKIGWSIPLYRKLFYPLKINTAMEYFNKAWLIDSLNANVYWGMAAIVANRDSKHEFAEELMEKAIQCDSNNLNMWLDYGVSNMEVLECSDLNDSLKILKYRDNASKAFQKVIDSNAETDIKEKAKYFLEELKQIK